MHLHSSLNGAEPLRSAVGGGVGGATSKPQASSYPAHGALGSGHREIFPEKPEGGHLGATEPIAIIGIGCRLPGEISSDSDLWEFLKAGKSGRCEVPGSRFNIDAFHHPDSGRPGSLPMRGGYFLQEDPRLFENSFFGINNLEATYMDPQQRKLLEVCFESFESAGARLEDLAGANVGCFVGNFTIDFQTMQARDPENVHRYSATGAGTTILSNRITHTFDLRGPSMTLDTACSSSLYCLHLACKSLAQRDCDSAIVAGANLIQSVEQQISTANAGVLSKTSTCHTFSAEADGYGRADGIGSLYLKRLSDAIRDNDPIRSIIRGTAVNSNGRTPGITLPSAVGQEAVIAKAYEVAGIDFDTADYVECHGTGTPVGDPIEVEAVASFYSKTLRSRGSFGPLLIGSVKSNLGHSEAASGITSIIKATLALEHRAIPATIGAEKLNPKIPFDDYKVQVVRSLAPWPKPFDFDYGHIPRASVNSFGYGGSNAHCILERAGKFVPYTNGISAAEKTRSYLLPFSAASSYSLDARINDIRSMNVTAYDISDLAYTLAQRRSQLTWRGFMVAKQSSILDDINEELFKMRAHSSQESELPFAFVFTGQGAQWPQMGKELLEHQTVFKESISRLDTYLSKLNPPPPWSLSEQLMAPPESSDIQLPAISQPICTAVQIALIDLLRTWNLTPQYVVGHSSGEIAAAYAAGHISAFYAIAIAYLRGQVVSSEKFDGAMIAVGLGRDAAEQAIKDHGLCEQVCVACVNSPESITMSGDAEAIEKILSVLQGQGKFARKLKTGGRAYHSHHMKRVGDAYESHLSTIRQIDVFLDQDYVSSEPQLTRTSTMMFSSVLARQVEQTETCSPAYWRMNLESPVLFGPAVELMLDRATCQFIEIGPHAALEMPVKQIKAHVNASEDEIPYLSVLYRNKDSERSALGLIGKLWAFGRDVSISSVNRSRSSARKLQALHDLPKYRWDYSEPLWKEPRASIEFRQRKYPRDELLGSLVPGDSGFTFTWRNLMDINDVPWIQDHCLADDVVFPAAGYITMAAKAAQQISNSQNTSLVLEIKHLRLMKALVLHGGEPAEMFTELAPKRITDSVYADSMWSFTITTFSDGENVKHATGTVAFMPIPQNADSISSPTTHFQEPQAARNWYSQFAKVAMNFGPSFQSLADINNDRMRAVMATTAKMTPLPSNIVVGDGRYIFDVHPITIDAQLQASIIATTAGSIEKLKAKVPVGIERIQIYSQVTRTDIPSAIIHASANSFLSGVATTQSDLVNSDNEPLVRLRDIRAAPFHGSNSSRSTRNPMLRVIWQPDISRLAPENSTALATCINQDLSEAGNVTHRALIRVMQLYAHRQCDFNILEIGGYDRVFTEELMVALDRGSTFQKYTSYNRGVIDSSGILRGRPLDNGELADVESDELFTDIKDCKFDFVIVTTTTESLSHLRVEALKESLNGTGRIMYLNKNDCDLWTTFGMQTHTLAVAGSSAALHIAYPSTVSLDPTAMLSASFEQSAAVHMIVNDPEDPINSCLRARLESEHGAQVSMMRFNDLATIDLPLHSAVIATVELHAPLLTNTSQDEHSWMQKLTDNASKILWVSGGNLVSSQNPEFAAALGLSRAIMSEQPSLKFSVVDLDNTTDNIDLTVSNLLSVFSTCDMESIDHEYMQKDGVLHISRFVPDEAINDSFRERKSAETKTMRLADAQRCDLSMKEAGLLDSLEFTQLPLRAKIPEDHVEINVKATSLNAKDLYTLIGKIETAENTCSCEYSGVVTRVGSSVLNFTVGDRVVTAAPGRFSTLECAPAWACHKIQDDEDFTTMSTAPVVFMTAIHALRNVADLQQGESVLIHSAAGGVGIAAIQVAKEIGADIYATVGTDEKKQFLVDDFGIDPGHIFNSRDLSFLPQLLKATNNRGVDVVLNSLTGEQLHCGLEACANFGRFVEIGKRDILDAGSLNMRAFLRNLTFSAFDLHELYYSDNPRHRRVISKLLSDAIDLFRRAKAPQPALFDVSDIRAAFRHFANGRRMGKVVVSYEKPESLIPVVPQRFSTQFSAEKSYLLVGCLGGLGRSISRYLLSNGARHFTFIGRSGTDKSAAHNLVEDLKRSGATVTVVRGDVQDYEAVQKAVETLTAPLGGVLQAAMGLSESLYTTMTNEQWHTGLGPKISGSWNLHRAIRGKEEQLDFFLMTSSLSGSVGSATESNYCVANSFLDHFAGYRRAQGLSAISVGLGQISEVGYLHEHPEIEQMLARRGIAPITEDDLLQIIDIALSRPQKIRAVDGGAADSHILTGLEPSGMEGIWSQGYEGSQIGTKLDPRLSILALATPKFEHTKGATATKDGLPAAISSAVAAQDRHALQAAAFEALASKLSNLVLMALDKISAQLVLSEIGMDSMLAAEYRTFMFRTFSVDVPFLTLMDSGTSMQIISDIICDGLLGGSK